MKMVDLAPRTSFQIAAGTFALLFSVVWVLRLVNGISRLAELEGDHARAIVMLVIASAAVVFLWGVSWLALMSRLYWVGEEIVIRNFRTTRIPAREVDRFIVSVSPGRPDRYEACLRNGERLTIWALQPRWRPDDRSRAGAEKVRELNAILERHAGRNL